MLEVGYTGLAKHSNRCLQILRGNYRKKAEAAIFEVLWVNEHSASVRPKGSDQKYGTQFPRNYLVPFEEVVTSDQDLFCRYCLKSIKATDEGAVPDIDPVTLEQSGFRHLGCQPDMRPTDSQVPSRVE